MEGGDTDTRGQPSPWEPPPRAGRGRFKGRGLRGGERHKKVSSSAHHRGVGSPGDPSPFRCPPPTHLGIRRTIAARSCRSHAELPPSKCPPRVTPMCHPLLLAPLGARQSLPLPQPSPGRGGGGSALPPHCCNLVGRGPAAPHSPPSTASRCPRPCRAVWGGGRAGKGAGGAFLGAKLQADCLLSAQARRGTNSQPGRAAFSPLDAVGNGQIWALPVRRTP